LAVGAVAVALSVAALGREAFNLHRLGLLSALRIALLLVLAALLALLPKGLLVVILYLQELQQLAAALAGAIPQTAVVGVLAAVLVTRTRPEQE
jgi:hypothetical protein